MKVCPNCNKQHPDDFNGCPECGHELTSVPVQSNINMGNANAISGGIHYTQDHSIKHDNSVSSSHNVSDSHNTTTNNIYHGNVTHIEREKTPEELHHERELKYRDCCKKALAQGILSGEERIWLNEQRISLDLSKEEAASILDEVYRSLRYSRKSMGPVQKVQYNRFKQCIESNLTQEALKLLPQIKVLADSFPEEDELQFLYYLVLTVHSPQESIDSYSMRSEDRYWQTFWLYISYHRMGDVLSAEQTMLDLSRWQNIMPEGNLLILGAIGSILEGDRLSAQELISQVSAEDFSEILSDMVNILFAIVDIKGENIRGVYKVSKYAFYLENFFKGELKQVSDNESKEVTEESPQNGHNEDPKVKAENVLKKYAYSDNIDKDKYVCLYNLYAIPEDKGKEAAADIMSVSQSNVPDAVCLLAFCFEYGIGVDINEELASRYYFYAANMKSIPAIRKLGDIFMVGDLGEDCSWSRALDYYLQIKDTKINASFRAEVLREIGMIYSVGDGSKLSPAPYLSENYYTESVLLGCNEAMAKLAGLYANPMYSKVWPNGITKAEQLLRKLDVLGELKHDVALELASAYDNLNDEREIPSALEWYNKAFELWMSEYGVPASMILFDIQYLYQYGKMVNSNIPIKEDLMRAYELYKAIYEKLESYKEEDYIVEDVIESLIHIASVIESLPTNQYYSDCNFYRMKWLTIAAEKGNKVAQEEITRLNESYGEHYWEHYLPLIGEEQMFELYEKNQLE